MIGGWWQPKRKVIYIWRAQIRLTIEEYETVEYFRKNLKLGWGTFIRMLLWEYLSSRAVQQSDVISTNQKSTWEKIQEHVKSGKWIGIPDKKLKCLKDPDLNPKYYAAAAYAYGVHPELSKLLHDYSLEIMRGKATQIMIERPIEIKKPKFRRGQME